MVREAVGFDMNKRVPTIDNLREVVFHLGLAGGEQFLDHLEQKHGPDAVRPLWDEWERLAADDGNAAETQAQEWTINGPPSRAA